MQRHPGCKHEYAIEPAEQMNCLSSTLDYVDVSPLVFFDTCSCVYRNFGADLDTDHFAGYSYSIHEVRQTSPRAAAHVEHAIALS
jgi:hypothetical protein